MNVTYQRCREHLPIYYDQGFLGLRGGALIAGVSPAIESALG